MWPPEVKSKAMLACGRRCCLCHKFAGVAMECHHIVPKSKRGEDTFENCIPLCLDCHTEVGHYSDDHPKGTKFTPEELRGHRDHWYAAHASGVRSDAPSDYIELDRKLYKKIYAVLGGSTGMLHFSTHDYGGSFSAKIQDRVYQFTYLCDLPETEFFDAEVSAALADLLEAVNRYLRDCVNRLWQDGEVMHVPPEWLHGTEQQEKRFDEAVDVLNKASTGVWDSFTQLVKTARSRLKIEHD